MKDFQMPEADVVFEDKASLKKELKNEPVDDNTIDEWCIASIENDLSDVEQAKFESEIEDREEFQQIYALYKQTKLTAENISFPDFKPWRLPNFNAAPQAEDVDFWVIAELEGDLTPLQKQKWNSFKAQISNIEAIEASYAKIKLQPETIIFPNKEELKHKKSRIRYLYPLGGIAAAAAAFYLFLNIANFKQDTFKNFNDQVAKIEFQQNQPKYVPEASFIPSGMLNQVAKNLVDFEKSIEKTESKSPEYTTENIRPTQKNNTVASIEPIQKREAYINVNHQAEIDTDMPVEVITADNLMGEYMAENSQVNYNTQRNKLTLFKVAQKGVNKINDKVGTEMKLEAQYNSKGEKKRVRFSNRLFTVTKTINK
jgi:hypothetical protein